MSVKKIKDWLFKEEEGQGSVPSLKADSRHLKPFGYQVGDGWIQLSFMLPVPLSKTAEAAAQLYAEKMGLKQVRVVSSEAVGSRYSSFVLHASSSVTLDLSRIKAVESAVSLHPHEFVSYAEKTFGRKVAIAAVSNAQDAEALPIDSILNRKGWGGEAGLESYACFQIHRFLDQLEIQGWLQKAAEHQVDVLILPQRPDSKTCTIKALKDLLKLVKAEKKLPTHVLKIVIGSQITPDIALKAGFDAGFSATRSPNEVASFILQELGKHLRKDSASSASDV